MATYVSTSIPHSPFVQPQYVHSASPAIVHTQLATPTIAPTLLATPTIGTPALAPSPMPSYYVPNNGYQRSRSHSMSYMHSPAPAPQPQMYYSYGQSQYPQAGVGPQPYYTTVHTASPHHDGYSRSRRASTSHSYHHGSPSHHRSHSSHGSSSHRRSHSTTRTHSRHHSQPQVIDLRHNSSSNYTTHYLQPSHGRRYSVASGPGIGDRLRNLFGMQPSHRAHYIDARTGREVDWQGRPIYHM